MTTPTLTVEIAFDSDPLTASPTWTDVTSYVRNSPGVRISRGRPTELDTFAAGQCSFTLDNRDARFSPLNSSSTYNGKLLPGKQVRITGSYGGTDYRLFRGFITGWPQRYSQGKKDAIVPIVAYDALAKLNEMDLPDMVEESLAGSTTFLRHFDSFGRWEDVAGNRSARLVYGIATPASSLASGLNSNAVEMTAARLALPPYVSVLGDGTYSFWIKTTSAGVSSNPMCVCSGPIDSGGTAPFSIGLTSTGKVDYWGGPGGGAFTSMDSVNDGAPHFVVLSLASGATTGYIWIDGLPNVDPSSISVAVWNYAGQEQFIGAADLTLQVDFTGTLQDFRFIDGTVVSDPDEAMLMYQRATDSYRRSTATAMGEVLDSAGWPSALRSIAVNTLGDCVATWRDGDSTLSVAQQIAASEQGRFFASGSGNVTLLSRYSHQLDTSATTVQATFSDDGADSDYVDVGFDYDDTRVRNQITVSAPVGSAYSEDATSVTAYGPQSASVSTFLPNTNAAQDMADGLIGWRKDPQVRSLPLTATLTDTAQFASLLGLELGERVKFEITPPGMGSQSAQELILEQMDWDISNALWELTVQGSPIPPDVAFYDVDSYDDGCVYAF